MQESGLGRRTLNGKCGGAQRFGGQFVPRPDDAPPPLPHYGQIVRNWVVPDTGVAAKEWPVRMSGAGRRAAAVAVSVALLSGCGITNWRNLSFRTDDRLHFVTPKNRSKVHQPVTVTWTIHDFRLAAAGSEPPSKDAGYFAVFVDRTPIRPRQTLKSVANGDRFCERDPKCPDASYLEQHQVYVTTATTVTLPQIANLLGTHDKVQRHTITVVLMDTAGHRIGESAWQLDLRIPRVGFS